MTDLARPKPRAPRRLGRDGAAWGLGSRLQQSRQPEPEEAEGTDLEQLAAGICRRKVARGGPGRRS